MADFDPFARRVSVARSVAITLVCWAVLSALHLAGAFRTLDLKLSDWRYRLRGTIDASDSIVLIEVDDATIQAYGRWPLLRDQYALLIHALTEAGVKGIGIDLLFIGDDTDNPQSDALLAQITADNKKLVHSVYFPEPRPGGHTGGPIPEELQKILRGHGMPDKDLPVIDVYTATLPYTDLLSSANALGHVVVATDRDGVIRTLPPFVRLGDTVYPCLALRLAGLSANRGGISDIQQVDGMLKISWSDGSSLMVPFDNRGTTHINFAGDRSAFRQVYSMLDVMLWIRSADPERLSEAFKNKVVVLGSTAVGQAATDMGPTPFSPATPLLLVHANALDCFLNGRFLSRPPSSVYLPILGLAAVALGLLFAILSLPWALATVVLFLVGLGATDYSLFALNGTDIPPTAALALPVLAYAAVETYQFLFLQRKSRERQKELDLAREIQRRLLPSEPPAVSYLDVFGLNIPAREVGGDYYDWITLEDGSVVAALGDVSGKGVGAALLVSHLYASFHAETREERSPRTIAQAMHESLFKATEPGRFATFFLAAFPEKSKSFCFCNAGHNPPLLLHKDGIELLPPTGVVLGILEGMEYSDDRRAFEEGDVLIVYSDGITECTYKDEMYEEERLMRLAAPLRSSRYTAEQIANMILDDVKRFSHGHLEFDDVTLLVVRRRQALNT